MGHWKSELDTLLAETLAFSAAIRDQMAQPSPKYKEEIERIGLKPLDYGGQEREEIVKRVQSFKAHQEKFAREREEYAAAKLSPIKPSRS
ncbi:hypothetical protein [uncultured Bradyrhizobium sp.]|uniref:hypothetical protein n=1 Tax=uncultured Bradyrhizobium sp. TaxID=199684 RepID=UPI00260D54DF|nr:hypothetical protein [uncultured Bradyrhizobium sp.]